MKRAIFILCLIGMPSVAFAHPGHREHDMMPPGQLIGVVAVTLGLAAHAWATWGDKHRAAVEAADGTDSNTDSNTDESTESLP